MTPAAADRLIIEAAASRLLAANEFGDAEDIRRASRLVTRIVAIVLGNLR